jgi:hypothetical protein
MDHHAETLDLHVVVPEEDGECCSCLHEDDGISDAFLREGFLRTTFRLTRRRQRVHLSSKVAGAGFPEFRRQRLRLVFRGCAVDRIEVGGVEMEAYDGRFEFDNRGEAFDLSFAVGQRNSSHPSLEAK